MTALALFEKCNIMIIVNKEMVVSTHFVIIVFFPRTIRIFHQSTIVLVDRDPVTPHTFKYSTHNFLRKTIIS